MPLLNYTTKIAVHRTLAEIQQRLVAAGASNILISYDAEKQPEAVTFAIATTFGERAYRLPARVKAVEKVLAEQQRRGKVPRSLATKEQAARVGWRILKDWVEAQLAILETGMVTLDEIMLPFMISSQGRTVYQVLLEQRLALPAPEKGRDQ